VFHNIGSAGEGFAIHNNTGGHNITEGNIFIDCFRIYQMSTWGGFNHYALDNMPLWQANLPQPPDPMPEPHATRYLELNNFWTEEQQYPTTSTLNCNIIVNSGELKDDNSLIQVGENYSTSDPGFVDRAGGDFTLDPTSEVFELLPCFEPIPFAEIGIVSTTEGEGEGENEIHSADQNADGSLNLSEVLRCVQIYNAAGYHCAVNTEDGYAPGEGPLICMAHTADYNPHDGRFSLAELLRIIQLFDNGPFHPCTQGEDGFCIGQTG
jgi:hypothetical protein